MTKAEKSLINWIKQYDVMPPLMTKAQWPKGVAVEDGEDIEVPLNGSAKDQAHGME